MILTLILFTLINLILAAFDASRIKKGKTINHFINAVIYTALVAGTYFLFHNWFLIAALLFNRLLFFNISLSLFRGLPAFYISPKPASVIDKIAKSIFGKKGWLMYLVYAIIFAASAITAIAGRSYLEYQIIQL